MMNFLQVKTYTITKKYGKVIFPKFHITIWINIFPILRCIVKKIQTGTSLCTYL